MIKSDKDKPVVIFVCTGNTCRSPMAEGLARKRLGDGYTFVSRGIYADVVGKVSKNSVLAMKEKGVDIADFKPSQLTAEDIERSALILTMTRGHKAFILKEYAEAAHKVYALCEAAEVDGDVGDPFCQGLDVYVKCADMIEDCIVKLNMENLLSH